jgi:outer membrane protein OmpA-like peptidoglycan-associated protein
VSLPSGKEYNLRFFKEGYEPVSLRINTEQFREYEQIRKNIVLRDKNAGKIRTNPDSSGELFVPEEVYFSQRSDRIPEPSLENLKAVAVYLKKNPKLKVILMGYAKEFDSKLSDLEWSARRADSIRRFLLVQGITEDRIVSLGYGDTPSRTEKLESNRAVRFHRKVVIRFE